jgi:hypothetical protein
MVGVELHETGEEGRHAVTVQVFIEVVAGGIVLPPPPATTVAERLIRGEFLARGKLWCGGSRPGVEAGRAQRGQPGCDPEKVAAPDTHRAEPRGQQVHLSIGDG